MGETAPADVAPALVDAADAVVWDMGASGSLEGMRAVARVPALVLPWSPEQAREALAAGARGVLSRERLEEQLEAALQAVTLGLLVVDEAFDAEVLRPPSPDEALVEPLTPRETEVLQLLAQGLTNRRPPCPNGRGAAPPAGGCAARDDGLAWRQSPGRLARREDSVSTSLESLSAELASRVEAAAPGVVRVEGRRRSASSGVVWSADGAIVASHHAVDADDDVKVGLHDGRTLAARVAGRDPGSDLALLRLEAAGLVPPRWAEDRAARPGELVLALSRPGRSARARLGVVSAAAADWRSPAGARFERYLESDIALHPGFSGSLLLAADGAALGVNTAGLLRGTSVAVPAAVVRRVVESLAAHGRIRRGWLGIGTQPVALTPDLRSSTGQPAALIVLSVQPESPAAKGGVRLGDVLLRAGDDVLTHPGALVPSLDADRVGRELRLRLLRAGEERELVVVVGERAAA